MDFVTLVPPVMDITDDELLFIDYEENDLGLLWSPMTNYESKAEASKTSQYEMTMRAAHCISTYFF